MVAGLGLLRRPCPGITLGPGDCPARRGFNTLQLSFHLSAETRGRAGCPFAVFPSEWSGVHRRQLGVLLQGTGLGFTRLEEGGLGES